MPDRELKSADQRVDDDGQGNPSDWPQRLEAVSKSNELANANLVQQNAITYQQALSQVAITGISKCFELISQADLGDPQSEKQIEVYRDMIDQFHNMVQTASLVAVKAVDFPNEP